MGKKQRWGTYHVKTRRSWESSAQAASSRLVPTSRNHSRPGMPRDSDGRRSKTSSPVRLLQLRNTTRFPDAIMGYGDIPFEDGKRSTVDHAGHFHAFCISRNLRSRSAVTAPFGAPSHIPAPASSTVYWSAEEASTICLRWWHD